MERTYTIPLRRQWLKVPIYKRSNRAVKTVRSFLQRHMKVEDVKLGEKLNNALWARGDSNPPHKITLLAKKEDDKVYAELKGHEFVKKDFSEKEEKPTSKLAGKIEAAKNAVKGGKTEAAKEEQKSVVEEKTVALAAKEEKTIEPTKHEDKTVKKAAKKKTASKSKK